MTRKKYTITSVTMLLAFCCWLTWPSHAQALSGPYFYVATAVDSSGNESVFSNQAPIGGCLPTAAKPHCALSWTASTSTVSGYNIYRSTTSGGPYTRVNASLVVGTLYTDTFSFPAPPSGLGVVNN